MRTAATRFACLLTLAATLCACSAVTQENYDRIEAEMGEAEVFNILGKPDQSAEVMLMRLKAVNHQWVGREHSITVQFVNARVRAKNISGREPRL